MADWLIGQGYTARVVVGMVKFSGQKESGHAWVILFDNGKEYILEATQKQKWSQLPLAKTLPMYHPMYMFDRKYFWHNHGSRYTVSYSSKKWIKSGEFLPPLSRQH